MRANHPSPRPFLSIRPRLRSPFVLTCEHARGTLPAGSRASAAERALLRSHWGWDSGAWELTRELARLLETGATGGRWTRLWIDLNRAAGDPTLVRREVEGRALSWNASLDGREVLRRYETVHSVYHREVDREIAWRLSHGVRPVLLAVHTYTPVVRGRERRYDAGVLYDENLAEARRLTAALRSAGLTVRYNQPYSGKRGLMYSIDRHGRHYRLPCLELEVNQAWFGRPRAVARVARAVAQGLRDAESRTRGRR